VHDTAYEHGRLFFALYGSDSFRVVIEIGSQDVNGSLRDHCPRSTYYVGLDVMPAKGVDLVINPIHPLPLADEIADAVVTSSTFEHDPCFWDTFQELIRILRPGGLLYLNAPSNGGFHRHKLDCWRFYPDAGAALVHSAARHGTEIVLLEAFIGQPQVEGWADFVAVFRKTGGEPITGRGRIVDHVPAINIQDFGTPAGAPLRAETEIMPPMQIEIELRSQLAKAKERNTELGLNLNELALNMNALGKENAILAEDLVSKRTEIEIATRALIKTEKRADDLADDLAQVRWELASIQNSTSWRMTAGLRWLAKTIRGR
jgi:SAM-dependent methyltransferase